MRPKAYSIRLVYHLAGSIHFAYIKQKYRVGGQKEKNWFQGKEQWMACK